MDNLNGFEIGDFMRPLTLIFVLLTLSCTASAALDIGTCGQTIPRNETGVLRADLVCSDGEQWEFNAGVSVQRSGKLDMNGHSITMIHDDGAYAAVRCESLCRVYDDSLGSRGRIIGEGVAAPGTRGVSGEVVHVSRVDIDGFQVGIVGWRRAYLEDVSIRNSGAWGVRAEVAKVLASTVSDCEFGIAVDVNLVARDTTVSDNISGGVDGGRNMRGTNVVVLNNGRVGINTVAGRNSRAGSLRLTDAYVHGHIIDLEASKPPRLRRSSCDTSRRFDSVSFLDLGTSWGVCSND